MKKLKPFAGVAAVALLGVLLVVAVFVVPRTEGAKSDKGKPACILCEIDSAYSLTTGQRGFYQLTDEEGGVGFNQFGQLEPGGRKVPAVVSALQYKRNEDGSLALTEDGRLQLVRDESGNIVVCVQVARPGPKGGTFDRCGAVYGSREPGGFDIPQPADKVGF
jgi:hypothetical protein